MVENNGKINHEKKHTTIFFLALLSVFIPTPAQAASELETWCLTQGQSWDSATSTCSVNGTNIITGSLNILSGENLEINGIVSNLSILTSDGHIYNNGTLFNGNIFTNNGTLNNYFVIQNDSNITNNGNINNSGNLGTADSANLDNNGLINNNGELGTGLLGKITNYNTINNSATISNNGTFINFGIVRNLCQGFFSGQQLPSGNPVISFENCSHFPATLR